MTYSEPLINQIRVFFLSVGMGVPVFLIYTAVQSFFALFGKRNKLQLVSDIVFCCVCTFVSFFFMVFYNSGRVRLHLIAGEAIGFYVFYRAGGKLLLGFCLKTAEKIHKVLSALVYPFVRVARAFLNIFLQFGRTLKGKFGKRVKSEGENVKKEKERTKKFDLISKIYLKNRNKSV